MVSQFGGFGGSVSPEQTATTSALKKSAAKNAQSKSAADTTKEKKTVLARSELGPWVASCAFATRGSGADWSEAVEMDMEQGEAANVASTSATAVSPFPAAPVASTATRWCVNSQSKIEFMIAMVPDPINTHLALDFDRRIEAIQWAAEDSGYFVDQYWLPWKGGLSPDGDASKSREEEMIAEMRSDQPGLQIFSNREQHKDEALYVFFVSETPTTGVAKAELENALDYIFEIRQAHSGAITGNVTIPILGPNFSGTAHGLSQILKSYVPSGVKPDQFSFHLISGSATSGGALQSLTDASSHPVLRYDSVLSDDESAETSLKVYLKGDLKLDENEIAILSESETQYGQGAPSESLRLRFPRGISNLRKVYPDLAPAGAAKTPAPVTGLPFDIKESLGNDDDIPALSDGQLPMSQEAVLLDIATTLRREKIKAVGVSATDVFDLLFLTRFLREYCPDIRVFTLFSDQLLVRAADTIPLDGTLAISNYPLFVTAQKWARPSTQVHALLSFPNSYSEATYNAFLALLATEPTSQRVPRVDQLLDVGSATANRIPQPRLWLTVVSRDGFWPVSILPEDGKKSEPLTPVPNLPSGAYLFTAGFFLILTFFHVALYYLANRRDSAPKPEVGALNWLLDFFLIDSKRETRVDKDTIALSCQKRLLFSAASFSLAAINFLVFWPLIWFLERWTKQVLSGWAALSWYWGLVACGWLALGALLYLSTSLMVKAKPLRGQAGYAGIGAVLFVLIVLFCALGVSQDHYARDMFLFRSLEIESGVSPTLPFVLVLAGIYLACWAHIRRARFVETRRPEIPSAPFDHWCHTGFGELKREIDHALNSLMFHSWAAYILPAALVLPFLLRGPSHLMSFEAATEIWPFGRRRIYEILLLVLLSFLLTFVVSAMGRFLAVWGPMRALLRRLERQQLRSAFDRLPKKHYSWTSMWHGGGNRRSFALYSRSLDCLRRLSTFNNGQWPELPRLQATAEDNVGKLLDREAAEILDLSREIAAAETALRDSSAYVLETILIPQWIASGQSDSLDALDEEQSAKPDSKQRFHVQLSRHQPQNPLPLTADAEEPLVVAEEFVVLRFVALINYVGLQLRNLLSFMSFAFILAVISLRCYPFLAHRTIGWTLTVLFLLMAVPIVCVFAQMDRDAVLSRLSDTDPGKLDKEFYLRLISYGALPLLTVLASQFPAIGRFLFSWVQPAVEALH
jgi:hypothetical protein